MTAVGVYVGNDPADFHEFESWLGGEVDFIRAYVGKADWNDWSGCLDWLAGRFSGIGADVYWSIPLIVEGATLSAGAAGLFNDKYLSAARSLVASQPTGPIHVRMGEEFNGDWFPWAAAGNEADYIATYRNMVDMFRSVSDRFVFEWNVNIGDCGMDPATAYPGDEYVDVIGMDFYHWTQWDPADPLEAWNYMVNRKYGLQWLEDFAAAHGKPTAYSEWGVQTDNMGVYLEKAAEWFRTHNVLYQSYWDSDADYPGKLSDGQYPTTGDAFRKVFSPTAGLPDASVIHGTDLADDLTGTLGADQIWAGSGDDRLGGLDGDDTLHGEGGNDTLDGGAGDDKLHGGEGGDALLLDLGNDLLNGGAGLDWVRASGTGPARIDLALTTAQDTGQGSDTLFNIENAAGGSGADALQGTAGDNILQGNAGADRLVGRAGNDLLEGGAGNDELDGGDGNDQSLGGDGDDTVLMGIGDDLIEGGLGTDWLRVTGSTAAVIDLARTTAQATGYGNDTIRGIENLSGGSGANKLYGDGAANRLEGNAGDDLLQGRGGADALVGGLGRDTLHGGAGDGARDVFVFNATTESVVGTRRDLVYDFVSGTDDLDLSGIDANRSTAADDPFRFSGTAAQANSVWYAASKGDLFVRGDVNGDRVADFEIRLVGLGSLALGDFIL